VKKVLKIKSFFKAGVTIAASHVETINTLLSYQINVLPRHSFLALTMEFIYVKMLAQPSSGIFICD
jgi:hypothetical protein